MASENWMQNTGLRLQVADLNKTFELLPEIHTSVGPHVLHLWLEKKQQFSMHVGCIHFLLFKASAWFDSKSKFS